MTTLASLPLWGTIGVMLCITLASYVQSLTGFAFGLIFLALVGVFDLVPVEIAANAVTLITLSQTIHFRSYPLTDDWRVIRPAIWPSLIGVARGWRSCSGSVTARCTCSKMALGVSVMGSALLLVVRFMPKVEIDTPSFTLTGLLSRPDGRAVLHRGAATGLQAVPAATEPAGDPSGRRW